MIARDAVGASRRFDGPPPTAYASPFAAPEVQQPMAPRDVLWRQDTAMLLHAGTPRAPRAAGAAAPEQQAPPSLALFGLGVSSLGMIWVRHALRRSASYLGLAVGMGVGAGMAIWGMVLVAEWYAAYANRGRRAAAGPLTLRAEWLLNQLIGRVGTTLIEGERRLFTRFLLAPSQQDAPSLHPNHRLYAGLTTSGLGIVALCSGSILLPMGFWATMAGAALLLEPTPQGCSILCADAARLSTGAPRASRGLLTELATAASHYMA